MSRQPAAVSFPVQPQRELHEVRKRVFEQGGRIAKILLNNVGLSITGREIPYKYTSLNLTGKNNLIAAITMVNHEINRRLGKSREVCSTEEFREVMDAMDDILQTLVRRVMNAKSEYENAQET